MQIPGSSVSGFREEYGLLHDLMISERITFS